ncbi:MAG TPA: tRNA 2-selenouridine(34) synthase MnmH [Catalimonadaceae bacterium]|nr:tRNA 2-selenouridine(34) synthase MnmH [Catalimonadaceae bacterium]HPI09595.1 tRNA 2-selenouridine(34) synthase MnmH [Catalimonadaceae bacterium]
MAEHLTVDSFLKNTVGIPVLDVRSPGEYEQGHIPGALSFPLFSNEERKEVGTLYKQTGPEEALLKGLDFVGPKMSEFVRVAGKLSPERKVAVHCWRGGMRSRSMAWLLETAGFQVKILSGGYKAFRNAVLHDEIKPEKLLVLGGLTGSGKTPVLLALEAAGEQVLDLEKLACHKGSAFGGIDEPPQPTQEQFENDIYSALFLADKEKMIWVEDESKAIGRLRIPNEVYDLLRASRLLFLEQSRASRLQRITDLYGQADQATLETFIKKIAKRLGGLRVKLALEALAGQDITEAASQVLEYYDRTYLFGLEQRDPSTWKKVDGTNIGMDELVAMLRNAADQLFKVGDARHAG